jgi:uncharacterized membrane protein YfcA
MLKEAVGALIRAARPGPRAPARLHQHNRFVAGLPGKMRFYKSGLYISPLAPFLLGLATGILTVIMGVGGGFIIVPAMIYLLGMSTGMVVGTSLFQIIFVTAVTTLLHSVQSQTVDIVLALLLLSGGVVGAQLGVRSAQKLPPERLRLLLALIVLGVAIRVAVGLTWRPAELYSVQVG